VPYRGARVRSRRRVQVVNRAGQVNQALPQARSRNRPEQRRRVRVAKPFIVAEEVGLPTQDLLRDDGPAACAAEAAVMVGGNRKAAGVVVKRVGVPVVVQVILVTRRGHDAWHGTGYEYYLGARGAVEVRGLLGGADLEFLDAIDRGRHHAGG